MDAIDKLASNPHVKLTPRQLERLRERRRQREAERIHSTRVPKHDPRFKRHPVKPEKEGDGTAS
jgi:hypothetical protein